MQEPSLTLPPQHWIEAHATTSGFVVGIELRSSYLGASTFTQWAISPDTMFHISLDTCKLDYTPLKKVTSYINITAG